MEFTAMDQIHKRKLVLPIIVSKHLFFYFKVQKSSYSIKYIISKQKHNVHLLQRITSSNAGNMRPFYSGWITL